MRICFADDEPLARERMRQMLSLAQDIELCGECTNGEDAIAVIREQKPDLVIIDIEMPKLDGFDVVETLCSMTLDAEPPLFIFATAFPRLAAQAFDTGAIDFVTKPIRPGRLELALSRARQILTSRDALGRLAKLQSSLDQLRATHSHGDPDAHSIWIAQGSDTIRLDLQDVDYVSAEAEYIRFHTGERSFLHRQSISSFEEEARSLGFVRVHRSYVVYKNSCLRTSRTSWGGLEIELKNGTTIPVGRKFRAGIQRIVN